MQNPRSATIYELVGGTQWFVEVIDRFYDAVDTDPVLRPLYPDDLTESREHMVGFLQQYFGGPTTYSEQRGHPRLRMRHAPFVIGQPERDAWLGHMVDAVNKGGLDEALAGEINQYFEMASTHMINSN